MGIHRPVVLVMGDIGGNISDFSCFQRRVFTVGDLLGACDRDTDAIVLAFPSLVDLRQIVTGLHARRTLVPAPIIVSGTADGFSGFQEYLDSGDVFYVSTRPLLLSDICTLIEAAVRLRRSCLDKGISVEPAELSEDFAVLSFGAKMGRQLSLKDATRLLCETIQHQLHSKTCTCFFFDRQNDALFRNAGVEESQAESPATGIIGFVARTKVATHVWKVRNDARYDPAIDSSGVEENISLIAVPVLDCKGAVLAVVAAALCEQSAGFTGAQLQRLEQIVSIAAPVISSLKMQASVQSGLLRLARARRKNSLIFREEALAYNQRNGTNSGGLLRVSPQWMSHLHVAFVLIALFLAACVVFLHVAEPVRVPATFLRVQQPTATPELRIEALFPTQAAASLHVGSRVKLTIPGTRDSLVTVTLDDVREERSGILVSAPLPDEPQVYPANSTATVTFHFRIRLLYLIDPALQTKLRDWLPDAQIE